MNSQTGTIYVVECRKSGKAYIGRTYANAQTRWSNHKSLLNRGVHANIWFQEDWLKHTPTERDKLYRFRIIDSGFPVIALPGKEREWIKKYREEGWQLYNVYLKGSIPESMRVRSVSRAPSTDTHKRRIKCRAMLGVELDVGVNVFLCDRKHKHTGKHRVKFPPTQTSDVPVLRW